jgi:hypothetical protein
MRTSGYSEVRKLMRPKANYGIVELANERVVRLILPPLKEVVVAASDRRIIDTQIAAISIGLCKTTLHLVALGPTGF